MNIKIKRYNELDLEELYDILALRNQVFIVEQVCVYQDCDGKDKQAYHLIATNETNQLIACLRILDKGVSYKEYSIGRVIVAPEYRKTGLATAILSAGIDFVKNVLTGDQIRISAQAHLRGLYESVGFVCCSDVYLEDDIPHIEMLYGDKS